MSRDQRLEAATAAIEPIRWVRLDPPPGESYGSTAQNDSETLATAALAASDALLLDVMERALFNIEGVHHVHGTKCLCGFESHRSRSRTEHITGEVRAALRAALKVEG